MCENGAVGLLVSMTFADLSKEVEGSLAFKARNADPRVRPYYSQILYAWYVERGDYRSGQYLAPRESGGVISNFNSGQYYVLTRTETS